MSRFYIGHSENELKEEIETEWQDILGNEDIKRKIIKQAPSIYIDKKPKNGERVIINYIEKIFENEEIISNKENYEFIVGDGDALPIFDMAIKLMCQEETSHFIVKSRFAYGKRGRSPDIPKDCTMTYEITLNEIRDALDYEHMNSTDIIKYSVLKKEKGNYWFNREDYGYAIDSYSRGLKILQNLENYIRSLDYDVPLSSEIANKDKDLESPDFLTLQNEYEELYVALFNNMAAAQFKMGAKESCLKSLNEVFRYKPDHVKALYRQSKVLTELGQIDKALQILHKISQSDPDNKTILKDIHSLELKKRLNYKQDKDMYSKMMHDYNTPNSYAPSKKIGMKAEAIIEYFKTQVFTSNLFLVVGFALLSIILAIIGIRYVDYTMPQDGMNI
ncbi:unnamed protein product [Gordionus sp. m RMFG-2023]